MVNLYSRVCLHWPRILQAIPTSQWRKRVFNFSVKGMSFQLSYQYKNFCWNLRFPFVTELIKIFADGNLIRPPNTKNISENRTTCESTLRNNSFLHNWLPRLLPIYVLSSATIWLHLSAIGICSVGQRFHFLSTTAFAARGHTGLWVMRNICQKTFTL